MAFFWTLRQGVIRGFHVLIRWTVKGGRSQLRESGGEAVTEELFPDTADPPLCLLNKSDLATPRYLVVLPSIATQSPAARSITASCKERGTSAVTAQASSLCVPFRSRFLQFFEQSAFSLSASLAGESFHSSSANPCH